MRLTGHALRTLLARVDPQWHDRCVDAPPSLPLFAAALAASIGAGLCSTLLLMANRMGLDLRREGPSYLQMGIFWMEMGKLYAPSGCVRPTRSSTTGHILSCPLAPAQGHHLRRRLARHDRFDVIGPALHRDRHLGEEAVALVDADDAAKGAAAV